MCALSIKVPIRKKSGNLFNIPRICDYRYFPIFQKCFSEWIQEIEKVNCCLEEFLYIISLFTSSPSLKNVKGLKKKCPGFYYF